MIEIFDRTDPAKAQGSSNPSTAADSTVNREQSENGGAGINAVQAPLTDGKN